MNILGGAVGSTDYVESWIRAKVVAKAGTGIENLHVLEDPQAEFLKLNHCNSFCRMVFFMRVSPPDQLERATKEFDQSIRGAFETLMGADKRSPVAMRSAGSEERRGRVTQQFPTQAGGLPLLFHLIPGSATTHP
jgi:hypothetical protein